MPAPNPNINTPHDPNLRLSTHPLYLAHQQKQSQIESDAELARRLAESVDLRENQTESDKALAAQLARKNGRAAKRPGGGGGAGRVGGEGTGARTDGGAMPLFYQRHHEEQWQARQQQHQRHQPSSSSTRDPRSSPDHITKQSGDKPFASSSKQHKPPRHEYGYSYASGNGNSSESNSKNKSTSGKANATNMTSSIPPSAPRSPRPSTSQPRATPAPASGLASASTTDPQAKSSIPLSAPRSPRPSASRLHSSPASASQQIGTSKAAASTSTSRTAPKPPEMEDISGAVPCGCPISEEQQEQNKRNVVAAYAMRGRGGVADGGLQRLFTGFWPKVEGRPWAFDGVRDP